MALQQPFNLFKPAKVIPERFEHQGVQQPQQPAPTPATQSVASVAQQAADAQQQARQTQQLTPQTFVAQPQQKQPTQPMQQSIPTVDPDDPASGMNAVLASMYTSPQEEERLRKASVANQRLLAITDALRHVGNIAHTVNYAPSQKFNTPVMEEYERYQKGKALRDAANLRYMTYQQQRAAQDRATAKMEMEFKLKQADDARKERLNDARISRYNAQNAKDGANQAYWETRARLQEEGWPLDKAIKEARKAQIEAQTRLTTVKANQGGFAPRRSGGGGGKGGTYWDYDEEGNIHYYPNKTMWEQGVESHSRGQQQQEEFKTIDGYGEQKVTYKKRPTVSKAGENASNANKKKTQPKQPQKKALPGQTPAKSTSGKKRLPGT